MRTVFTSVLVIGGGIAALRAALAARKGVDDVLMVSKGVSGKSGCSLISEGILNGPFSHEDSEEIYFNDIMRGSAEVADESLARKLSERAKEAVLSLQEVGIRYVHEEGELSLSLSGGNSVARTVRVEPPGPGCGKAIPIKLREAVGKTDIATMDNLSVVKLLKDDGRAVSAIAYDGEEFVQIFFRSVVVATGGGGRLYRNSTNPNGIVGDGFYLAHDLGASLIDMEYVQFFPTVALTSYLVLPFVFTDGATLVNGKGERFIGKYDAELMERTTRDKMSQAIFTEDLEGRGIDGGVYISFKDMQPGLLESKYKKELEFFKGKGIDLRSEPLLVRPACHYFMGGIKVDDECRTDIDGLFACGECAGGVHGANRLAGNALVETLVFGDIAGASAAEYAKGHDHVEVEANDFLEGLPECKDAKAKDTIIDDIKQLAWKKLGIIRDKDGLADALRAIDRMEKGLPDMSFGNVDTYFEARNGLHVLRAIADAALAREESRGAHYRSDHPSTDPKWKKSIIIKNDFDLAFEKR